MNTSNIEEELISNIERPDLKKKEKVVLIKISTDYKVEEGFSV